MAKLLIKLVKYPSLLLQGLDKLLGSLRARWEYRAASRVSPLAQIYNPNQMHIGDDCYIAPFCVIRPIDQHQVEFGENCTLQQFGFIAGSVKIGDDVRIANKVSIHSFNHGTSRDSRIHRQSLEIGEVKIEDDVWIGANVTILKDVCIGEGAVIAAGSVVTEDVAPYSIVAGTPAKKIDER